MDRHKVISDKAISLFEEFLKEGHNINRNHLMVAAKGVCLVISNLDKGHDFSNRLDNLLNNRNIVPTEPFKGSKAANVESEAIDENEYDEDGNCLTCNQTAPKKIKVEDKKEKSELQKKVEGKDLLEAVETIDNVDDFISLMRMHSGDDIAGWDASLLNLYKLYIGEDPEPREPEMNDSDYREHNMQKVLDAIEKAREDLQDNNCLLYTSPSPRDRTRSRMPSSA